MDENPGPVVSSPRHPDEPEARGPAVADDLDLDSSSLRHSDDRGARGPAVADDLDLDVLPPRHPDDWGARGPHQADDPGLDVMPPRHPDEPSVATPAGDEDLAAAARLHIPGASRWHPATWNRVIARLERRRDLAQAEIDALLPHAARAMPVEVEPAVADEVPRGLRVAAAWSWRLLLVAAGVALLTWVVWQLRVVTFPLVVAIFLATVLAPPVIALRRLGLPRGAAAGLVTLLFLLTVLGLLTLVGGQIGGQVGQVVERASDGIGEIRAWLETGPLGLTQDQIAEALERAQDAVPDQSSIVDGALSTASAAAEALGGLAIALFALFFFLYDGPRIWAWIVGLAPPRSQDACDGAGRVAFATLVGYVRATLLVAAFDAVFITVWLLVLGVPLAVPIGVLVFFGAFIPLVGAFVTAALAILVALVTDGVVLALLVLLGIIAVQQIESHLFQPLVVGRMVHVHPLAVVLAISIGAILAGIIGAIVAVPMVAVANSVRGYLRGRRQGVGGRAQGAPAVSAPGE